MGKVIRTTLDFMPPVTAAQRIELDGVQSVVLHNAGNADVKLNRLFTVRPGSTMQISVANSDQVIFTVLNISFGAGDTPLLEWGVMRQVGEQYSNYTSDDPTD